MLFNSRINGDNLITSGRVPNTTNTDFSIYAPNLKLYFMPSNKGYSVKKISLLSSHSINSLLMVRLRPS